MDAKTMTLEQQADLLERFLRHEPMAELTLVSELRPLFRREIYLHWSGLLRHMRDLRQQALLDLWEKRETEEGRQLIRGKTLEQLARALLDRHARKLRREKPTFELTEEQEPPVPANQEPMFELGRLLDIAADLPRGMSETIRAHAAHMMGKGPPLHEALGIDPENARKRLARAQAAVWRISKGEKVEADDE